MSFQYCWFSSGPCSSHNLAKTKSKQTKRLSYGHGDSRPPPGQSRIAREVKIVRTLCGERAGSWLSCRDGGLSPIDILAFS